MIPNNTRPVQGERPKSAGNSVPVYVMPATVKAELDACTRRWLNNRRALLRLHADVMAARPCDGR